MLWFEYMHIIYIILLLQKFALQTLLGTPAGISTALILSKYLKRNSTKSETLHHQQQGHNSGHKHVDQFPKYRLRWISQSLLSPINMRKSWKLWIVGKYFVKYAYHKNIMSNIFTWLTQILHYQVLYANFPPWNFHNWIHWLWLRKRIFHETCNGRFSI